MIRVLVSSFAVATLVLVAYAFPPANAVESSPSTPENPALDAQRAPQARLAAGGEPCPEDVSGDGTVDVQDLLALLAAWGPCPEAGGACCLPDHACIVSSESECAAQGGTFQGEGTTCEVDFCGVCCIPGKNKDDCDVFSDDLYIPSSCDAQGGYFLGECTYCAGFCDFVNWGGCCLPDGTCIETTDFKCEFEGGQFLGEGGISCDCLDCEPAPVGACCVLGIECQELNAFDCDFAEGQWQGPGTVCEPGFGACCFDGFCETLDPNCCELNGGTYLGNGTDCADCP